MKLRFIPGLAVCCVLLSVIGFGQAAKGTQNIPKIVIDKTDHNFGEVKKGEKVTHTFTFKNAGSAELKIINVAPACGCTASDYTRAVAPGGEGKITLSVETAAFQGPISKTADVYTNDPARERFTLMMSAVVTTDEKPVGRQVGPFIVGPSDQALIRVPQGMNGNGIISITNVSAKPVRITGVKNDGDAFSVALDNLKDGARYSLNYVASDKLSAGSHRQTVRLTTDNPDMPELVIRLEVEVTPVVVVSPAALSFENLPVSNPETEISLVSKFVWLKMMRGTGLEVKSVTSDLPFVTAKVEPNNGDGRAVILRVGFSEKPKPGQYQGVLRIETNNAMAKSLEISIKIDAK